MSTTRVLAGLQLGDVEEIDVTSTGDTKVQGWLVKPPGFRSGAKISADRRDARRPAFDVQRRRSTRRSRTSRPRASWCSTSIRAAPTGYGSTFGNASDKADPGVDYDDLMAGVNEVIGRGWVDTTRMYVGGCRGGGVLSAWVIGHTTRFAAAAVRCPVTDWISFAGRDRHSALRRRASFASRSGTTRRRGSRSRRSCMPAASRRRR